MAKIRLYETTKEINKNMKGLSGKLDNLKSDMDQYFQLLNVAKSKAEQKARELEEKRKQEEMIAEVKRKEEESRLDSERQENQQQQEQEQLKKAQWEKEEIERQLKEQQDKEHREIELKKIEQEKKELLEKERLDKLKKAEIKQTEPASEIKPADKRPTTPLQGAQRPNQVQGAQRPNQAQGAQRPNQAQGAQRPNQVQGAQRPNQAQGAQRPNQAQGAQRPNQNQGAQRPNQAQGTQRPTQNQGAPSNTGRNQIPSGQSVDRKPYGGNRQQGQRGDIVDKFMSQPPVAIDKDKVEPSKGSAPRYGDTNRDKNRKSKKDHWQDSNINALNKKSRRPRKDKKAKPATPPPERKKAITMGDFITVKELSERIGIQVSEIIKKLLGLGVLATINQELDYDIANLIASEFDIELERKSVKSFEKQLEDVNTEDAEKDLVERPPVVTVMGHVDHGKTSLLDAIRNANVTGVEAGGITQHIGAYTVNVNDRSITFLDTPGHEAFTSMRARGAQVTDIAILVVAADDGIMPQTIEAINHAKAAEVPIIIAINKMDKPTANPERIKQELTEHGLVVEEWGGDTIAVPVSALKKEGIEDILEMILLVAEVQDLKANPSRFAKGTIIEAELDKGRGPVATILVQNGTLRIGDSIVAGTTYGRVRAMIDDKGRRIKEAGPSIPVEVLGLNEVPDAGDVMYAVEDDKLAKQVSEERRDKFKAQQVNVTSRTSLDELFSQLKEGEVKDLNIIIKADVQGSVEAVRQALEKLSSDQVHVRSIHGGVGAITESDVLLASASNAIITGFNVRPSVNAVELAEREEIDIRTYRVIYNAIEDIEAAMKGLLDPEFKEVVIGHASVRTTFKVSGIGTIAGSYVTDGKITRSAGARVVRDGIVIHEGKIDSLKRFKDDVREVASNYECGIGLENFNDIKEEDVIEAFVMEEIKR